MKVILILSLFTLLFSSCQTKSEEKLPFPFIPREEIASENEVISFSNPQDRDLYYESLSSKDNPYTLYNEDDLYTNYTFVDKVITPSSSEVIITNSENINYNYILKDLTLESVQIESDTPFMLTLENTIIKAEESAALIIKGKSKCFINLVGESTLLDSKSNSKKGVIVSDSDLIINGSGSLSITANKKHGIKCGASVRLASGCLNIENSISSSGNGISTDVYFIQDSGSINIIGYNYTHGDENKGIKVNGTEEKESGLLVINGGEMNIITPDKALTAGWKIREDSTTETTDDDPNPSVYINNGIIKIKTLGNIYEYNDDDSLSPEGIEAKNELIINGGYIQVSSSDDALNAGSLIKITNGYVLAQSRSADALDSNGLIEITGGSLIALGSNMPEAAIDCDNDNNFIFTGGDIIAISNGNSNLPRNILTTAPVIQTMLNVSSFTLKDKDQNVIIEYTLDSNHKSASSLLIGSDKLKLNEAYTLNNEEFTLKQYITASFTNHFDKRTPPTEFSPSKFSPTEDPPSELPPFQPPKL